MKATARRGVSTAIVLVMLLGMIPLAAYAVKTSDFPDADYVNPEYLEAVDVLTGLQVVAGTNTDSGVILDPQGFFTRAQAAVIAARMSLGTQNVLMLPQQDTGFKDIDGTPYASWAGPSIAWAKAAGLVTGRSDTEFCPHQQVTAVEFAILCLRMLGYGKNGEYQGAMWATNGYLDGFTYGILTLNKPAQEAATREEVMVYAFNTLLKYIVGYNSAFGQYYNIGTNLITGEVQTPPITLGARSFGLTYDLQADVLGHGSWNYNVKGAYLAGPYGGDGSVARTYRELVTSKIDTRYFYNTYKWNDTVELWVNGGKNLDYKTENIATTASFQALPLGSVFTIYEEAGKVVRVVVEYEMLGLITNITGGTATAKVFSDVDDAPSNDTINIKFDSYDFYEGDYILIKPLNNNPGAGKIRYDMISPRSDVPPVVPPVHTSAVQSLVYKTADLGKKDARITLVGGKEYDCSYTDFRALGFALTSLSFTEPTQFFFDSEGMLIGYIRTGDDITAPPAAARDYVYVKMLEGKDGSGTLFESTAAQAKASVIFPDGSSGIVDLTIEGNMVVYLDAGGHKQVTLPTSIGTNNGSTTRNGLMQEGWFSYTKSGTSGSGGAILTLGVLNGSTEFQRVNVSKNLGSADIALSGGGAPANTRASSTTKLTTVANGVRTVQTGFAAQWAYTAIAGNTYTMVVFADSARAIVSEIIVISETAAPVAREFVILTSYNGEVAGGYQYSVKRANGEVSMVLLNPRVNFDGKLPLICEITTAADGRMTATEFTGDASYAFAKDALVTAVDPGVYMVLDGVVSTLYYSNLFIQASAIEGGALKANCKVTCIYSTPPAGLSEVIAVIVTANAP